MLTESESKHGKSLQVSTEAGLVNITYYEGDYEGAGRIHLSLGLEYLGTLEIIPDCPSPERIESSYPELELPTFVPETWIFSYTDLDRNPQTFTTKVLYNPDLWGWGKYKGWPEDR